MNPFDTIRTHAKSHAALAGSDAYSAQEAPRLQDALEHFARMDRTLRELVDACTERQRALDACTAARQAAGAWSQKPLPHTHPAVQAVRHATARQAEVLKRAREFIA